MARLQLNKSSLAREARSLRTYERFLPSLDLKRQQLMAERAKAAKTLAETGGEIARFGQEVGQRLPMLANLNVDLTGLATVTDVVVEMENLVGTRLPRLERIEVRIRPYALLSKPHWVDTAAVLLRDMLELRIRLQVEQRRVALLDEAVKTITQRVNLFDKVLIPRTKANIKRIRVYLSDEQMAAVVRSKISKRKHAAAGVP
ncbi:V-type ATP synthase subunit D [Algihabitans albus]|uniref:V-type ATP synthase subunit D n=1 Tax=Algihabitans albus TaxID=2164067 RepID=UPI000E5D5FB8|nr:V-type ATP synthase subunit D [Algihabitans albus]